MFKDILIQLLPVQQKFPFCKEAFILPQKRLFPDILA